ncbi:efflux RND transporter periplasmic adaptor subunit [Spirosoma terrae]|uniref:Efflux RND transporter periplasmic adaptor subunit n=1 Tax=Spirosoma terrae TaxID=1968276 RepID=A0A6L9L4W4_9BACT|nr:efflux RND transporter periplasmic adaptor subunit [Spirosoma terrae]NDU94447.1 efflux RND transporter periplasmic adaptor subunit [Spirosoma terrae]
MFSQVHYSPTFAAVFLATSLLSCSSEQTQNQAATEVPALPVVQVKQSSVTTYQEFAATLEGRVNVDIRPQVEGYLEKIYVDEGASVRKGQPLFRIDTRTYREQVGNADATLLSAKANLEKAALEVTRLTPLVENNVVSDVQLKAAQSAYAAAKANVEQAKSMLGNANVNLDRTLIKAPVSGFIGRLPYKAGSLVGRSEVQPLTTVSDVQEIYAYFSMSEVDFLRFTQQASGGSMADKIRKLPAVDLILADGKAYAQKGHVEMVSGQFDKTMGAISFRAVFPNSLGLLRSGITGRVRIPEHHSSVVLVPQEATFERQDRVFVFALADSNKVVSKPLQIVGKSGNYYLISKGIQPGDRIVHDGLDRLRDGDVIAPKPMATDSSHVAETL